MKKMSVLFLSLIALVAVFTSCNPIVENPELTLTQSADTVFAGVETVVTFTAVCTPDVTNGAELATLTIMEGTTELKSFDLAGSTSSVTKTFDYTVTDDIVAGTKITLNFSLEDLDGNAVDTKAYIEVGEVVVTFPELVSYSGKLNYISTSLLSIC